jgi:hypothetical protein
MASERDLVAPEGVDEGSAASTVEGEQTGAPDVVGPRAQGAPPDPEQGAAPVPVESPDLAALPRTGQQQQVGER